MSEDDGAGAAGTRLTRDTNGNQAPVARDFGPASLTTARTCAHRRDRQLEENAGDS